MKLGCEAFVDFTKVKDGGRGDEDYGRERIPWGFITATSNATYEAVPKMVRMAGRVMCVGLRDFIRGISS